MLKGNWKKAATLTAAIGTIAATYAIAFSPSMMLAVWQNNAGTINVCNITNDRHIGNDGNTEEEWVHEGPVAFEWVENSPPGSESTWSRIRAVSVEFDGESPTYGSYHISLDNSRPLDSRIEALTGEDFPAQSTMTFHAILTFDEQPGVEFRTVDASPIIMQNPSLDHWPHNDTEYNQVGSTVFANADEPSDAVFTLSNASLSTTAE